MVAIFDWYLISAIYIRFVSVSLEILEGDTPTSQNQQATVAAPRVILLYPCHFSKWRDYFSQEKEIIRELKTEMCLQSLQMHLLQTSRSV